MRTEPHRRCEMGDTLLCASREYERRAQTVVCECQRRVQLQCCLQFPECGVICAAHIVGPPQRTVRTSILGVEHHCPQRGCECLLAIVRNRICEAVYTLVVIGLGEPGMCGPELRVPRDCLCKIPTRALKVVL